MKKTSYTLYDKVKVYSGAPVNKGFYDRNLNRANKLYIKDNWKPPKPKNVKEITKKTFSQKVSNYLNEYKILKKKFNFPEEEEEKQIKRIDKYKDYNIEFDQEKIIILNKIIDDKENNFTEKNYFNITDEIINSIKDDKNYNNDKDLFFLKTTQNSNDYNMRLFKKEMERENENENENQNELKSQKQEDKYNSLNNINNEGKIDENNEDQYDENNIEQIIENNENNQNNENNEEKNNDNNKNDNNNVDNKDDENIIIKKEKTVLNKNINKNDLLKEKIINKNEDENIEYPLLESIIKSDYNKEYSPEDYYNEEFKNKLEEIQEINENENKIESGNNNDDDNKDEYDYENEFQNEEANSYNVSKVFDENNLNESNNNKMEMVEDIIKDNEKEEIY